jgi:Subtilase family
MKACPFCFEQVRDEAIRCGHCTSILKPGKADVKTASPFENNQAVYTIDRDLLRSVKYSGWCLVVLVVAGIIFYFYGFHIHPLPLRPDPTKYSVELDSDVIRFATFAASVLAVFITVGLFLYGFEIKSVAKEARDSLGQIRQARTDADQVLKETQQKSGSIDEEIASVKERSQVAMDEIQAAIKQIDDLRQTVQLNQTKIETTNKELQGLWEEAKGKAQKIDQRYQATLQRGHSTRRKDQTGRVDREVFYSVPQLARLYDFPGELDGAGQCIGLIELGGGYEESDLDAYFQAFNLPRPVVTLVSIDGATNNPEDDSASQVALDIETAGAVSPGARIVVYIAPNTAEGFLNAVTAAVNAKENRPSILSISWGSPEEQWQLQALARFNGALQQAALTGITVLCACGDEGVTDGLQDGQPHVSFPASSPWVLACGGTRLSTSRDVIDSETVWNDPDSGATGGGVSGIFEVPAWQSVVNALTTPAGKRGRAIPDISAHASVRPGFSIFVHGRQVIVGGTAGATPLLAGLIARINQGLGRNLGYFNPDLYQRIGPQGAFRDIVYGDNGTKDVKGYAAGPGWDAASGWGSPNGRKLLDVLRAAADSNVH